MSDVFKDNPKFEHGFAAICKSCFKRFSSEDDQKHFEELRVEMKSRLKTTGLWGKTRVVESTCLGACPKEQLCIYTLKRSETKMQDQCLYIDPKAEFDLVEEKILEALGHQN